MNKNFVDYRIRIDVTDLTLLIPEFRLPKDYVSIAHKLHSNRINKLPVEIASDCTPYNFFYFNSSNWIPTPFILQLRTLSVEF